MGLDKCVMSCIHDYSIVQSSFTAIKILCAPSSPQTLPNTDAPMVSIVFFPRMSHLRITGNLFSSLQFGCSVVSDSLRPHGL